MSSHLDNRNRKQPLRPSAEFLEVLKYELALTAETMAQELTELQIMGYLEALTGMTVEQIRAGFKRARRTSHFFPKPIEVRELAHEEIEENAPKSYYQLPAHDDSITTEEGRELCADIKKALSVTREWEPPARIPVTDDGQTIFVITDSMRDKLRKQVEELKAKYPKDFEKQPS